jgi:catechol 2,3-dioxygenase-like lactoylglutathione lyase family enzyme
MALRGIPNNLERQMITGLDHVVILVGDVAASAAVYERLLARAPSWHRQSDGAETVLFTLPNISVELMAPVGEGPTADRIRQVLKLSGEGLASLCFRVDDAARMHRRLDRVALKPDSVAEVESHDLASGATLSWKRAATDATRGVRLFFLELARDRPLSPPTRSQASITS